MSEYKMKTQKSWYQTTQDLDYEFEAWGVKQSDWEVSYPRGARSEAMNQSLEDRTVTLRYKKDGRDVVLTMGKQSRAVENIRVLYIAINTIRMNERRGIGEIMQSAYIQLGAGGEYQKSPYEVLGLSEGLPITVYEAMYREKVKEIHPDVGGSEQRMAELNLAIEKIRGK